MKNLLKKTTIIAACAILLVSSAQAQKGYYIGIQTGAQATDILNRNNIDKSAFNHKRSYSPTVGINGGYNFTDHFGVSTEASLSMEGQRYELHGVEVRAKQTYLKVPVLFTYNSNPESKVILTAKLGPQVGLLLNAKQKDGNGNTVLGDTKDNYSTVTFGAAGGVGVRMAVAKNIYLDAGLKIDAHYGKNKEVEYSATINESSYAPVKKEYRSINTNVGVEVGVKYFF